MIKLEYKKNNLTVVVELNSAGERELEIAFSDFIATLGFTNHDVFIIERDTSEETPQTPVMDNIYNPVHVPLNLQ